MQNAVIIADKLQINGTGLEEYKKNWSGLVFDGGMGTIYGTTVTPTDSFTIPENHTLTIGQGQTLTISEGVTLANKGKIQGDGTIDNKGIIKNYGTMTGTTVTGGDKVYEHFHNKGEKNEIAFAKLPESFKDGELSEGSYYLDEKVDLDQSIQVKGRVDLCLNGYKLEYKGSSDSSVILVGVNGSPNSTLNLYDCQGAGKITGGTGYNYNGGGVGVYLNSTFNMYGGNITGNKAELSGGGVFLGRGTFNMYGGSIDNNTADRDGGGVSLDSGTTFNMYGGSIKGNISKRSGGVDVFGTFNMSGGSITDNKATSGGGGVCVFYNETNQNASMTVSGNPVIQGNTANDVKNNVYLYSGRTITIGQDGLTGTKPIGVTTQTVPAEGSPVNITSNGNSDYSQYFSSDLGYAVKDFVDGASHVLKLVPKDPAPAIMLGASGISGGQTDSIYFGNYQQSKATGDGYNTDPIKWRVLDAANNHKTNSTGATTTSLFLLSDIVLDCHKWNENNTGDQYRDYGKSDIHTWLTGTFQTNAFNQKEQGAIATTYVETQPVQMFGSDKNFNVTPSEDKVFLLSKEEAMTTGYGFSNSTSKENSGRQAGFSAYANHEKLETEETNAIWWLCSPGNDNNGSSNAYVAFVKTDGSLIENGRTVVDEIVGVRPAFNLDLSKVAFTSSAAKNKPGSFSKAQSYNGNEWKLTLKDGDAIITGTVNGTPELTVGYSEEQTLTINHKKLSEIGSDYNHITAALTDSNNNVLYYGSINTEKNAEQSTVNIPTGLPVGSYTLSVYGEQWNGAKMTDYATATPLTTTFTVKGSAPSTESVTINYEQESISFDSALEVNAAEDFGQATNIQSGSVGNISNYISDSGVTVYVRTKDPVSEYTTFIIPARPEAPAGLVAHNISAGTAQNGKITKLDKTRAYQYSIDQKKWTNVQANSTEITGLAEGTYYVRFAAVNNSSFASSAATLTVGKAERTITLPDAAAVSANSVTLAPAELSGDASDGTVQYGYSTTNNASGVKNWQKGLTFTNLLQFQQQSIQTVKSLQ